MIKAKRITIDELRQYVVVAYTPEDVNKLEELGIPAIQSYIYGGIIGSPIDALTDLPDKSKDIRKVLKSESLV